MFNPFHRHNDDAVPPAFLASGMVAWEENSEEEQPAQAQELTPDDCCWCWPGTVANSVCASHIEAIASTPRRRH